MYSYHALITKVIDGDTVSATVDLGFDILHRINIRLYGINAPELHGATKEAGLKSKARLVELIENKMVIIESKSYNDEDKYGRSLAIIYKDNININDLLVKENLAVPYLLDIPNLSL